MVKQMRLTREERLDYDDFVPMFSISKMGLWPVLESLARRQGLAV
jgi:hypothetical protein